jgi:PST family polysaccharide transporter
MGTQTLGLFMLATRVVTELSQLLTEPLRGVAMAACARAQEAREELHDMIIGLYRMSRLLVFPVFLAMAALAPFLIPWLFGPRWEAAVPAIQILTLSGLRLATGAFNAPILLGVGRPQLALILFGVGCLLHIVLFPTLAPWGVVGASIAMLGRQFGNWPVACLLVRRATGLSIRRQVGGNGPVLLSAVIVAAMVWFCGHVLGPRLPVIVVIVLSALVGAVSYIAALRMLSPTTLRTAVELISAFVRRDRARLEAALSRAS